MSERRTSLGPTHAQQDKAYDRMMARWQGARKWPWRDFLTEEESAVIAQADEAKAEVEAIKAKLFTLNAQAALIRNRALQRAKYAHLAEKRNEAEDLWRAQATSKREA